MPAETREEKIARIKADAQAAADAQLAASTLCDEFQRQGFRYPDLAATIAENSGRRMTVDGEKVLGHLAVVAEIRRECPELFGRPDPQVAGGTPPRREAARAGGGIEERDRRDRASAAMARLRLRSPRLGRM